VDFDELQELIQILESSELSELEIEEEGRRIRLSKGPAPSPVAAPMHFLANGGGQAAAGAGEGAGEGADEAKPLGSGLITIDSPMVGTFFASSGPGNPPFVLPGDTVEAEQTVCIVEAMKVMNEVIAKVPAIIEKVLVESGDPVEFGQPLFTARPLV
jgi:acetyl-CoA carboxylase biotin carboxyl carrier protein